MKLLVTMRTVETVEYTEPRHAISFDWVSFCQQQNITPIFVPSGLERYDEYFALNPLGLILTGGNDVGTTPTERDKSEFTLIELAIQHQLPILGVCRGLQILNTYFGGSLSRQLNANHIGTHDVVFTKPIFNFNKGDKLVVNSFHHHGVLAEQLAPCFENIAQSPDGCIEFIEHQTLPISAILWHPERDNPAAQQLDQQIFQQRFKR